MSLKSGIKRIVKSVLNNVSVRNYNIQSVSLSLNELLKGRVALITGGTSGIGFNIARAFLNSGATVIITGRSDERLKEACEKLNDRNKYANHIFSIVMDNRKVDTFQSCFNDVLKEIQKVDGSRYIDILVNNAGISSTSLPNALECDFDAVIETNLKSVFFLSQLFGKYLKENKIEGNILNIASSSSLRPATSAYTLSKWGIRGLTLGLAKSLAPYGITVNGLAPGPTATPMLLQDASSINLNNSPIKRYVLPEEIANMSVILVSSMGRTIIGDIIYMTGGSGVITYDDVEYSF